MAETTRIKAPPTRRYWVDVHRIEMETIWKKTPFEPEVPQLCYSAFLASFLSEEPDDVEDRRQALWQWLRGPFGDGGGSSLARHYQWLPVEHYADRVISSVCTAYNEAPSRTFASRTSVNQALEEVYAEANMDAFMREVYESLYFINAVAARPVVNYNGELTTRLLTPDRYRVKTDPSYPDKPTELWIPVAFDQVGTAEQRTLFRVWREDFTYIADHTGTDIQQPEPNRYGRIPYILPRLRQPRKGYYGSGLFKLAEANIRCNALQYQTLYNATYNAVSVWIARNLDWENNGGSLDPGEVIVIEDERGPSDGGDMPGELNSVSADATFTEIDELRREWRVQSMKDHDVPTYEAEGEGGPESGLSRFIKRLPLMERRRRDVSRLRKIEREMAELTALVCHHDLGLRLPEVLPGFAVDFAEESIPEEPASEFAHDVDLWERGFKSTAYMVRKWGGVDKPMTEKEAVSHLISNKELMARVAMAEQVDG